MFIWLMFNSDCLTETFSEFIRKKGKMSAYVSMSCNHGPQASASVWLIIQIKDVVVRIRQKTRGKKFKHIGF